jgi:anion-transporting  ArsA/GET3 family ATPase
MGILGYALRTVEGEYRHKADVVVLDAPATGHGASLLAAPLLLADLVAGGQIGDLSKTLARFIADPKRCGVVLATLAEEMPVQELKELVALLQERLGRPPELVVVNGLYPRYPGGQADRPPDSVTALWRDRRAVNERELKRLGRIWKGPRAELPLLPLDRGPELLRAVTATLGEALA